MSFFIRGIIYKQAVGAADFGNAVGFLLIAPTSSANVMIIGKTANGLPQAFLHSVQVLHLYETVPLLCGSMNYFYMATIVHQPVLLHMY